MEAKDLRDLRNVGKATLQDLKILNIHSISELSTCDPTELFERLENLTGKRQDPCVWDVFAAIIHESKTGEPISWWAFTAKRKQLQKAGKVKHVV